MEDQQIMNQLLALHNRLGKYFNVDFYSTTISKRLDHI